MHSSMMFDAPPADTPGWHARQQLKLADFGLSKAVEADTVAGSTVGTVCGTPEYTAPGVGRMRQHILYVLHSTSATIMKPRILAGAFGPLPSQVSLNAIAS